MTVVWVVLILHFLLLGIALALALGTRFRQADIEERQARQQARINGLTRWLSAPSGVDGDGDWEDEEVL